MGIDTESLILETARKHFVKNGFAKARMQEIADEAGINKAMLHYYFRSKDKLYQEVLEHTLNMMVPRFAQAIDMDGGAYERIENLVTVYIDTFVEHPDFPIFIMSELSQSPDKFVKSLKNRAAFFPKLQDFVLQLNMEMEEGKIRKYPPLHLMLNIISLAVFPFVARPVFQTIFDFPEDGFLALMKERKTVIMDFVKNALKVD